MTDALRTAELGTQIVAYAYFAMLGGALVLMVGAAFLGRLRGKGAKLPNPVAALLGVAIIIGVPGALAAAMALLVTPILLAMPLPLVGWLLVASLALWGFYEARMHPTGGMEGCTQMFIAAYAGFGLCWAGAAIWLAAPPAGNAASFLRPLLVAAPVALFIGRHTRRHPVRQAVGFELLIALFLAIAFLSVENGFAQPPLPSSDWLRFPIMGAIVFGFWPLLSIPLTLLFGKRAIRWKETIRAIAGLGIVGGLFGLAWAFTRLLF